MELPDFLNFEPLNDLRQRMGAEKLGHFEFFEPKLHLTGDERAQLAEGGITADWSALRCLQDYSLVYKNSRILLFLPQPDVLVPVYHLAYCRTLQGTQQRMPDQQFVVATALAAEGYQVCGECLQQLQFDGYDGARSRHREYSERVRERFSLTEYFARYPVYPVNTGDLRHARLGGDIIEDSETSALDLP